VAVETVSFEGLPARRFGDARAFYETMGYRGGIADDCTVFVARIAGAIIGVVRLAPENGVIVLRGMMIAEAHQRQGIGARLLRFIEPSMAGDDVYCLPHDWLEGFYGRAGFVKIHPAAAPPHLQQRLMENKVLHPDLIIMARAGRCERQ
jgi:GNAT superfamily N-acetyltransferase